MRIDALTNAEIRQLLWLNEGRGAFLAGLQCPLSPETQKLAASLHDEYVREMETLAGQPVEPEQIEGEVTRQMLSMEFRCLECMGWGCKACNDLGHRPDTYFVRIYNRKQRPTTLAEILFCRKKFPRRRKAQEPLAKVLARARAALSETQEVGE